MKMFYDFWRRYCKSNLILLDLHGEYCWKDDAGNIQSAFPPESVNYVEATELEMPYWMMTYAELIDLFIDRSDSGASIQTLPAMESEREGW